MQGSKAGEELNRGPMLAQGGTTVGTGIDMAGIEEGIENVRWGTEPHTYVQASWEEWKLRSERH